MCIRDREISVLNQAVQSLTEAHDFERQLAAPSEAHGAESVTRGSQDPPREA